MLSIMGAFILMRAPLAAAELIMFHQRACEWCELWHEEIGVVYGKTPEAKKAPLRLVDIFDDRPADLNGLKPVVFTPTFVIVEKGREVGRILGYPGEDFFWSYLNQILGRLKTKTTACTGDPKSCQR